MDIKAAIKKISFLNSNEEVKEIYDNVYEFEEERKREIRKTDNKFIFTTILMILLLASVTGYLVYSHYDEKGVVKDAILSFPFVAIITILFMQKIKEVELNTEYILERESLLDNMKSYSILKEIYEKNPSRVIYYDIAVNNLIYVDIEGYDERLRFKCCNFSEHIYDYDIFELNEDGSINFTLHSIGVKDSMVKLLDDNIEKYNEEYKELDDYPVEVDEYISLFNDCYQVTGCSLLDEGRVSLLINYISKTGIIKHIKLYYVRVEQNLGENNLSLVLNNDGDIVLKSIA